MKRRILAMLLAAALVLSLAGCGGDSDKLVGKWRCEIDMTDYLYDIFMQDTPEMAEYLHMRDVIIVYYAEFHDDATVCMYADEAQLSQAMEDLADDLMDCLCTYTEETLYEQTGLRMTVEEILEFSGMSLEELRDSLGIEAVVEEMADGLYTEGRYKADDGKLLVSAGLNYDVDPAVYELYTLSGDVLTITGSVGSDPGEFDIYPMVFTRAA